MLALIFFAGIVLSMIGAVKIEQESADTYYGLYVSNFPTPSDRLEFAHTMLPVNGTVPAMANPKVRRYPTRAILASQWGDSTADAHNTAHWLYATTGSLQDKAQQTIAKFNGMDPEELFKADASLPAYGFSVELGTPLDEESLTYGSAHTSLNRKRVLGIPTDAKALSFQVQIESELIHTIWVDPSREVEFTTKIQPSITLYAGAVCLENNLDLYHNTREIVRTDDWVFGSDETLACLQRVMQLVGGRAPQQLNEWLDHGFITPQIPAQRA